LKQWSLYIISQHQLSQDPEIKKVSSEIEFRNNLSDIEIANHFKKLMNNMV
jgi:hypothetical protein